MLELKKVTVHYGTAEAIKEIDITIDEGSVVSVIGANGAGKSTILRAISGLVPLSSGNIQFLGVPIKGLPINRIVSLGIAHVPEGRRLFARLSVTQNLTLGAYTRKSPEHREATLKKIFQIFPVLASRKNQYAGTLSGGEQQMLAIGRGLISDPTLLIFDEPSLGLAPIMVNETIKVIKKINGEGKTILLVEQNVRHALANSDRAYVLENGTISMEGTGEELMKNKNIKTAYLGL